MIPRINKGGIYILAATLAVLLLCVMLSFVFTNILRQIFIAGAIFMLLMSVAAYFINIKTEENEEEKDKP